MGNYRGLWYSTYSHVAFFYCLRMDANDVNLWRRCRRSHDKCLSLGHTASSRISFVYVFIGPFYPNMFFWNGCLASVFSFFNSQCRNSVFSMAAKFSINSVVSCLNSGIGCIRTIRSGMAECNYSGSLWII